MLIVAYILLVSVMLPLTVFQPVKKLGFSSFALMATVMVMGSWRLEGVDRDVYLLGFENWDCVAEASYHYISDFVDRYFGDVRFVFLFYAVVAITIKLLCIVRFLPQMIVFGSILVYLSHFYVLHEMVQIRCGLASAFFLAAVCLRMKKTGSLWSRFVIPAVFIAVASVFHHSAVLGFIALVVPTTRFSCLKWGFGLGLAMVFCLFGLSMSSLLGLCPFAFVQQGVNKYLSSMEQGQNLVFNPFGVTMMVRYVFYVGMLIVVRGDDYVYRPITYLMKLYGVGLLIALMFADMPAMAVRSSQFLFAVEIFLIPMLAYRQCRERAWMPIVVFSVVNAALNVFLIDLFQTGVE